MNMEMRDIVQKIEERQLEILTIKVRCKKCGNIWGISLDEYTNKKRFVCLVCLEEKESE